MNKTKLSIKRCTVRSDNAYSFVGHPNSVTANIR